MSITKKEQQTISFYDQNAEQWGESLGNNPSSFWSSELTLFCSLLSSGHVLDIGAGLGKEARVFINAGYQYTGVEPADGLRKKLLQRFPDQIFINGTVYDWPLKNNYFDGFWCSMMLLHIPQENIDFVLQQIKKTMKHGAIGFISLAQGQGEYFDEDTKRYFYLYTQDEFTIILQRNGFIIENQSIKTQETHRAWLRTLLTYFVRVNH